jgi:hypothetical protein
MHLHEGVVGASGIRIEEVPALELSLRQVGALVCRDRAIVLVNVAPLLITPTFRVLLGAFLWVLVRVPIGTIRTDVGWIKVRIHFVRNYYIRVTFETVDSHARTRGIAVSDAVPRFAALRVSSCGIIFTRCGCFI